jgi:hypothetical protein
MFESQMTQSAGTNLPFHDPSADQFGHVLWWGWSKDSVIGLSVSRSHNKFFKIPPKAARE